RGAGRPGDGLAEEGRGRRLRRRRAHGAGHGPRRPARAGGLSEVVGRLAGQAEVTSGPAPLAGSSDPRPRSRRELNHVAPPDAPIPADRLATPRGGPAPAATTLPARRAAAGGSESAE